jgi:hypothetical protein
MLGRAANRPAVEMPGVRERPIREAGMKTLIAIMIVLASAWSVCADETAFICENYGPTGNTREVSICDSCDAKTIQNEFSYRRFPGGMIDTIWESSVSDFSFGGVRFCDDCMKIVGEILKEKVDARKRSKGMSPIHPVGNVTFAFNRHHPQELAVLEGNSPGNLHIRLDQEWGTREIVFETDTTRYRFTRNELLNTLSVVEELKKLPQKLLDIIDEK